MASFLQVVFAVCIVVAVGLLTDWRWAFLLASSVGFVSSFQWDRRSRGGKAA